MRDSRLRRAASPQVSAEFEIGMQCCCCLSVAVILWFLSWTILLYYYFYSSGCYYMHLIQRGPKNRYGGFIFAIAFVNVHQLF